MDKKNGELITPGGNESGGDTVENRRESRSCVAFSFNCEIRTSGMCEEKGEYVEWGEFSV